MGEILYKAISRQGVPDDPQYKDWPSWGKPIPLELRTAIHPAESERVVVSFPGYNEPLEGYRGKHAALLERLRQEKGYAVVRSENPERMGFRYEASAVADLQSLITHTLEESEAICGRSDPRLTLMGYSAGACAAAIVAPEYASIDQLVLLAPSGDTGADRMLDGIRAFAGELYLTIGDKDSPAFRRMGIDLLQAADNATARTLIILHDCTHFFKGTDGRSRFDEALERTFQLSQ